MVSIFKRFKDCEKMLEDTKGFDFSLLIYFYFNFIFFVKKRRNIRLKEVWTNNP